MIIAYLMLFNRGKDIKHSQAMGAGAEAGTASILATPGAGVWEEVAGLRPVDNLLAIAFEPGGMSGVAIGSHGEMIVTRDGGATWNIQGSIPLSEMSVATCVALPEPGRVLYGTTIDEDWPAGIIQELQLDVGLSKRVWQGEYGGLLAASRDGRFWAGENCLILRADSSGFIPTRLPSCEGKVIYDIEAKGNLVLVGGINGLIAVSNDEGNTWMVQQLKPPVALENEPLEIHRVVTSNQLSLAGGNYGGLWMSEDRGETWEPIRGLGKRMNVWALYIAPNSTYGFVGGGDSEGGTPFIMATGDGGKTFNPEPTRGAKGRIMGIARGERGVFAVSFDGRLLARRTIL
jgi:photosystem II stability/assembly factor-like uncharacterized protein